MQPLKKLCGKTAIRFSRADFMLDDKEDEHHFGPLQIQFQDNSFFILDETGDAETISFSAEPLVFEHSGRIDTLYWKEIVLNDRQNWNSIVNKKILTVYALYSILKSDSRLFGIKFLFENGITLSYFNCYDDSTAVFDNDSTLIKYIDDLNLEWKEI